MVLALNPLATGRRSPRPASAAYLRRGIEVLENRIAPAAAFSQFVDPHPSAGNQFGATVVPLSTGNVVVTAPLDDTGDTDAGAVYLYDGATGALISELHGSHANDQIGSGGVTLVGSGNFVVLSPLWNKSGAVTWGNGSSGVSGEVGESNSLVSDHPGETIGSNGVILLPNGNYLVRTPQFSLDSTHTAVGAVTFGDGNTGVSGAISSANSLLGDGAGSQVGLSAPVVLSNGNYVVSSPRWVPDGTSLVAIGAVTWGSGEAGVKGIAGPDNSLVGSSTNDQVGAILALKNGNYVVYSSGWNNGAVVDAGAVTWGNGATGTTGRIDATNSLVGTSASDLVGAGVFALTNGNYVVQSPSWHNGLVAGAGAVTWGNGAGGLSGPVSAINSLVGSTAGDNVGIVVALSNGNYVVSIPGWDDGALTDVGAVTWGNGSTGISGEVNTGNSLIGAASFDSVGSGGLFKLSNGNYLVSSRSWDNGTVSNAGALTWGSGTSGISGVVSASNSLVGSRANEQIGFNSTTGVIGVTELSNGNYVVLSPGGSGGNGAVTWGSGDGGVKGVVDLSNSLLSTGNSLKVVPLANGNYLLQSFAWNGFAGAVTWASGTSALTGNINSSNSLVGSAANDGVGAVTILSNGNYVVTSPLWNNGSIVDAGAVTWGSAATGVRGVISASNSLVGSTTSDQVGSGGVTVLSNGNYVVSTYLWDNGAVTNVGAVTWGNGASGISGPVSASNSLVGSTISDQVGFGGVTALTNGNYVVTSTVWDNGSTSNAGAVTWGNGASGVAGAVSASNSLVGSTPSDQVGGGGVTALSTGNFVVRSPSFDSGALANAGAVTWGSGTAGVSGTLTRLNSAVGFALGTTLSPITTDTVNQTFLARFVTADAILLRAGSQVDGLPVDPPTLELAVSAAAVSESSTSGLTYTFTRLGGDLTQPLTVHFNSGGTAAFAGDYTASSSETLDFAAGTLVIPANSPSATITLVPVNDSSVEASETATLMLTPSVTYLISRGSATGLITDNDTATVTLSAGSAYPEGDGGTTAFTFTATLDHAVQGGFSVAYGTSDGTATVADHDYLAGSGLLTFAGIAGETQTVTILVNGDTKFENDESFTVALGAVSSAPAGVSADGTPQAGTITNDDTAPSISIAGTSVREGNTGPAHVTFTVSLSNASILPVTVDFSTADGTAHAPGDYVSIKHGTLTFAPGETSQNITVDLRPDTLYETDETFLVRLSHPEQATLGNSEAVGTILTDDDISAAHSITVDARHPFTFFDHNHDKVTVRLIGTGTGTLTLEGGRADGADISGIYLVNAAKSTLSISVAKDKKTGDGLVRIGEVTVDGALTSFSAPAADFAVAGLQATGMVKTITAHALLAGEILTGGTASDRLALTFRGALGVAGNPFVLTTPQTISALRAASVAAGDIQAAGLGLVYVTGGPLGADITSTGAIGTVLVRGGGVSGDLIASRFGSVSITGGDLSGSLTSLTPAATLGRSNALASLTLTGGDLTGDIRLLGASGAITVRPQSNHGGGLHDASIVASAIASLTVAGDVTSSVILAGADLGADHAVGGGDDNFASGRLGAVKIGGGVSGVGSLIAAGFSSPDGVLKNIDDAIIGGVASTIASLRVGRATSDAYFAAGLFRTAPTIDGRAVPLSGDSRFLVD